MPSSPAPSLNAVPRSSSLASAWRDIGESLRKYHLIGTLGWHNVATRYRRSRIGAFWLTINMAVMITAIGMVFGTLFQRPMTEFLPYLATGLVIWGFISTSINEGCTAFADQGGIILQLRLPLFVHVARVLWRNFIIFGHNLLIVPLVFLVFGMGAANPYATASLGIGAMCIALAAPSAPGSLTRLGTVG